VQPLAKSKSETTCIPHCYWLARERDAQMKVDTVAQTCLDHSAGATRLRRNCEGEKGGSTLSNYVREEKVQRSFPQVVEGVRFITVIKRNPGVACAVPASGHPTF
jgi:hypothetical protein